MNDTQLMDELQALYQRESAKLERVRELESEIAALRGANTRLHAQLSDILSRPEIALVSRVGRRLERYPVVKRALRAFAKRITKARWNRS